LQIPDYLKIAVSDVMPFRLSDLSDPKAQPFFDDVIADAELIIVDNLSTICPGVKETMPTVGCPFNSGLWLNAAPAGPFNLIMQASRERNASPRARTTCWIP
jgi:hypothetical protein